MWWCCFVISHSGTMGEIVQWREGFHSVQPSIRTTPCWQPHNWAPCFFAGCRTSMGCTGVSCWGRRMPQNRAPHSARHSWLPQNCSTLGTPTLSEVQQWQRYAIAQDLLNRYQREGDDFLGRIVTLDELGLARTNHIWSDNQMNGSILAPLVQRQCVLHRVRWRRCSLWHWWSDTAPHCPSKTDSKLCLLLQFPP